MSPMPSPPPLKDDPLRIEICKSPEDLARHAALVFVTQAGRALGTGGRFSVALAGGRTPRAMYALLTEEPYAFQVVWPAVHLFWSDERCVPPGDPSSNYRMVRETMLDRLALPEGNVHRIRGEDDPAGAAEAYERDLIDHFGGQPRLDLVMLGMGEDGHTASLFPSSPVLDETGRLAAGAPGPDGLWRVTLTLSAINAARMVMVMVSGEAKADMIRRVLGSGACDEGLPIQRIRPAAGRLLWLLDAEAAAMFGEPPV